jgi:signal transduction histidine kinase/ActR/RegA family two-component response regulator
MLISLCQVPSLGGERAGIMSPIRITELAVFRSRTALVVLAVTLTIAMVAGLGLTVRKAAINIADASHTSAQLAQVHGDLVSINRERGFVIRAAKESGDRRWESRYRSLGAQLEKRLHDASELAVSPVVKAAAARASSLRQRVALAESRAFAEIRKGNPVKASQIISDPRYVANADAYNKAVDNLLSATWEHVELQRVAAQKTTRMALIGAVVVLIVLSIIWYAILRDAQKRGKALAVAQAELLAYRDKLEQRVRERTQALKKARDTAESASKAKSEFLAVMSHEIRTPLNGILGMTKALSQTEVSSEQSSMLEVVEQSGAALLTILNDVLDMSKIEAGEFKLHNSEFTIREISHSSLEMFGHAARSKGLNFEVQTNIDKDMRFVGDAARIRQVLNNLLSNAVKFTQKGGIKVFLSEETDNEQITYLSVSVIDTGAGIPLLAQKSIFDRFTQVDSSLSREHQGTGLGLAICKELVERMDGEINLKSEPGNGSKFCFFVSVKKAQTLQVSEESGTDKVVAEKKVKRALRILVAEDNPTNRMVIKAILSHAKAEVTFVEDGQEAVKTWQAQPFDLVLMDIQMPHMNGVEATQAIRQIEANEHMHKTPIVAVTANAMPHQRDEYLAAGMDDHVAKPIEPQLLYAAMKGALNNNKPANESAPFCAANG